MIESFCNARTDRSLLVMCILWTHTIFLVARHKVWTSSKVAGFMQFAVKIHKTVQRYSVVIHRRQQG